MKGTIYHELSEFYLEEINFINFGVYHRMIYPVVNTSCFLRLHWSVQ